MAKPCRICDKPFTRTKSTQFACSLECALIAAQATNAKKAAKALASSDKVRKKALRTPRDVKPGAQRAFNRYIRARDYLKPCIYCKTSKEQVEAEQSWKGGCWDAAHFRGRGKASHLSYRPINCWRSCKACNGGQKHAQRFNSDDTLEQAYEANLVTIIGQEAVDGLKNDNKPRTFTVEELDRITELFNKRARYYEKRRAL